jgi:hypothetical protein
VAALRRRGQNPAYRPPDPYPATCLRQPFKEQKENRSNGAKLNFGIADVFMSPAIWCAELPRGGRFELRCRFSELP